MTGTSPAAPAVPGLALRRVLTGLLDIPPAYYGTIILLGLAWTLRPILLSPVLFMVILRQAAPLGMVVLGQSIVVRCRSIDLAVGGVIVGTNYIASSGYLSAFSDWTIIAVCLAFGVLVGAVNGLLITRFRASAVIVTLAMTIIFVGVVVGLSNYRPPGQVPGLIRFFGSERVGGFPVAPLVWLGVLVPLALGMRYTVFGRYLDAVGANPDAAAISGIPHLRVMLVAHILSGLMAALGGLLLAGFVGIGSATIGQDLVLNSLAAVILGGVNFGGGRSKVLGPAVGAFMLTFLFNFLNSFGLDEAGKLMMQGVIIAGAALIYSGSRR